MSDTVSIFYPENRAGGFSRCDGTVQFYERVHALLRPDYVVIDFGAGRGAAYYQDPSLYRKSLRNLRGEGRRVVGVDVDPVVSTNPYIDEVVVIEAGSPLLFPPRTPSTSSSRIRPSSPCRMQHGSHTNSIGSAGSVTPTTSRQERTEWSYLSWREHTSGPLRV